MQETPNLEKTNIRSTVHDPLPPGMLRQLQRLAIERRPGACVGCGHEHNCRRDGCAVLRKISRIVARAEGGTDDDA